MAFFLHQAGRDFIVLERNEEPGSYFREMPRHRKLISINKRHTGRSHAEYNLRHDWHSLISNNASLLFTRYSTEFFPQADAFRRYLAGV